MIGWIRFACLTASVESITLQVGSWPCARQFSSFPALNLVDPHLEAVEGFDLTQRVRLNVSLLSRKNYFSETKHPKKQKSKFRLNSFPTKFFIFMRHSI